MVIGGYPPITTATSMVMVATLPTTTHVEKSHFAHVFRAIGYGHPQNFIFWDPFIM